MQISKYATGEPRTGQLHATTDILVPDGKVMCSILMLVAKMHQYAPNGVLKFENFSRIIWTAVHSASVGYDKLETPYDNPQWRTEERVRGFEPLPLAYYVRNKRIRVRQNMVFLTKNTKNFLGSPQTLTQWGGGIRNPRAATPTQNCNLKYFGQTSADGGIICM